MHYPWTRQQSLLSYSATRTHPGHQRAVNEDAAFSNNARGLWVVADGMGGYAAGDVASRQVVRALAGVNLTGTVDECIRLLKQAILAANQQLLFDTTLPPGCQQLGSTVTVLFFHAAENCCVCLWVGDSRLYAVRDHAILQITRDHSVVQEMVDNGLLDESMRDSHPQSHVITRAVGIDAELQVDIVRFEPREGDLYLLCSDGLYNEISLPDQLHLCRSYSMTDTGLMTERIAASLLAAVLQTEARDNVTVTVVAME